MEYDKFKTTIKELSNIDYQLLKEIIDNYIEGTGNVGAPLTETVALLENLDQITNNAKSLLDNNTLFHENIVKCPIA